MVAQDTITIRIPKHGVWQRATRGERRWKALDVDFFNDDRIVAVMAECPDAVFVYQYLLLKADDEGLYETRHDALKIYLRRALGVQSNRFKMEQRLQVLANAGLIEVEGLSNPNVKVSKSKPNEDLKVFKSTSKASLNKFKSTSKPLLNDFKTPLETPKPATDVGPYNSNNNNYINNPPNPPTGGTAVQDESAVKKSKPPPKYLEDQMLLAERIAAAVKNAVPFAKVPDVLDGWADTIRLMVEQDGIPLDKIWPVFDWANRDDFWKANIRSPDKLRKQFALLNDRLGQTLEKAKADAPKRPLCLRLLDYEWCASALNPAERHRMADYTADPSNKMFGNSGVLIHKTTGDVVNPADLVGVGMPTR